MVDREETEKERREKVHCGGGVGSDSSVSKSRLNTLKQKMTVFELHLEP